MDTTLKCLHRLMVVPVIDGEECLSKLRPATVTDLCNAIDAMATLLSGDSPDTRIVMLAKQMRGCLVTMLELENMPEGLWYENN